jgi:hypothetical protein
MGGKTDMPKVTVPFYNLFFANTPTTLSLVAREQQKHYS